MQENDPRQLLAAIAEVLQELKIPYLITGGTAVLVWGRPRFTADIDIVVELKIKDIVVLRAMLAQLGKANYIDKQTMEDAVIHRGEFNFIHGETGVKVDFWVSKNDLFENMRMKRKIAKKILGQNVYFISPEDLIISKLRWRKISPSSRHMEDIESILKISGGKLDKKYLKYWIAKLGLEKLPKFEP
jgi:hypothetical protein